MAWVLQLRPGAPLEALRAAIEAGTLRAAAHSGDDGSGALLIAPRPPSGGADSPQSPLAAHKGLPTPAEEAQRLGSLLERARVGAHNGAQAVCRSCLRMRLLAPGAAAARPRPCLCRTPAPHAGHP